MLVRLCKSSHYLAIDSTHGLVDVNVCSPVVGPRTPPLPITVSLELGNVLGLLRAHQVLHGWVLVYGRCKERKSFVPIGGQLDIIWLSKGWL